MFYFTAVILAALTLVPPTVSYQVMVQPAVSETPLPPQRIGIDLPLSFDARVQWPGCIHPVLDQGHCGSCWSFAATEVLSDRFCIFHGVNVTLSPQDLLSCERLNLGCLCGSLPQWAWPFLVKKGVSTLDCVPYTSGSGHVEKCPSTCADGSALRMYHAANYTHAGNFLDASKHIDAIMREVMRGPVDVTFNVFSDFKEFDFSTGGVYKHQNGTYEGLHSVEIVGWGAHATTNTPYWLIKNSWGASFGDSGYFRIIRGENDCGIESLAYAGDPLLSK